MWQKKLETSGWPKRAATQFPLHWAPSTLRLYDRQLARFQNYCSERDIPFPANSMSIVADFLCDVADGSNRPLSILKSTVAALSSIYQACNCTDVTQSKEIRMLMSALVKSGTEKPLTRSKVMPVEPFSALFAKWPDNETMSIKMLRLKSVTLLALAAMLRPSDVAPKGVSFAGDSLSVGKLVFSTDQVHFLPDGSAMIQFFGTKNDTNRQGFEIHLPKTSVQSVDPISALKCYIHRTDHLRPKPENPVFLTLRKPYKGLDSSTVASILNEAINLVGLQGQGYSAKCFRPTGATVAIQQNQKPETVMKIGRWKTQSIFYDHYVHEKTADNYTDSILQA